MESVVRAGAFPVEAFPVRGRPNLERDMARTLYRILAVLTTVLWVTTGGARAQTAVAPPAGGGAPAMAQDQLDALLAPVALYPDQLLTQVLMAATYPLDVVEAARFVKENKDLKGEALDGAVGQRNWDPSAQSLAAFPQVLEMMSDKLDWTQQLGDAFLDDEARVLQTVQRLREKASTEGNLKSNEQQKVVVEQKTIIIEPAQPSTVYVPVYNPLYVYGPWWAPVWRPWYWAPPPYYYPGAAIVGGAIGFGIGWAIGANHWHWCHPNWRGGNVNININRNNTFINNNVEFRNKVQNGNWAHSPAQRRGVAYSNANTREKFQKVDKSAVSSRRDYRGHQPANKVGADSRPTREARPGGVDRPGGGGAVTREARPGGGFDRPGGGASGGPTDRFGGMSSAPNRGGVSPGGLNKAQTQNYSNRGAASRASAAGGRSGAGGGRGGGGGGGRGGGGGGGRHR